MNHYPMPLEQQGSKFLFFAFGIWSFFVLCRPQDYIHILVPVRPILSIGSITLVAYFLSVKTDSKLFVSSQFRLYVLLVAVMFASVPFSYYKSLSLKSVLNYGAVSTMLFILFFRLVNTAERIRLMLYAYCFGTLIYTSFSLRWGNVVDQRLSFGSMFDPNDIAFYVINFLPFNFLFISKGNGLKRFLVLINVLLGLMLILKTGSRGGLIAGLSLIAYIFLKRTKTLDISLFKKVIAILVVIVGMLTFVKASDRFQDKYNIQTDYNVTDEMGRISIWKIGLRMIMENPLSGVGVGCFSEGVGKDRERRGLTSAKWQAPHNSLIQIGAETGVIGLIIFALMSLRVFKITAKVEARSQSEDLVRVSEMTQAGFFGHCLSAMFLSQAYSFYWIFYIALSAQLQNILENER